MSNQPEVKNVEEKIQDIDHSIIGYKRFREGDQKNVEVYSKRIEELEKVKETLSQETKDDEDTQDLKRQKIEGTDKKDGEEVKKHQVKKDDDGENDDSDDDESEEKDDDDDGDYTPEKTSSEESSDSE